MLLLTRVTPADRSISPITDNGDKVEGGSDIYLGHYAPCGEYRNGAIPKSVAVGVKILPNVFLKLDIGCRVGGPKYNLERSARAILRVGKMYSTTGSETSKAYSA